MDIKNSHTETKHFCSCPVNQCPRHPDNHHKGCDPCIQDNLKKGKMPACFFRMIHDDVSEVRDYSVEGFAGHFAKYRDEYKEKFRP